MRAVLTMVAGLLLSGCGAAASPSPAGPPSRAPAPQSAVTTSPAASLEAFEEARADIRRHDLDGDWSEEECLRLGQKLASIATHGGPAAESSYDAGVALARCGRDAEATPLFRAAVAADPRVAPARVQVAALRYEADRNLDAAIGTLEGIVLDSQFQSTEALVTLARFQRWRAGAGGGPSCPGQQGGGRPGDDLDCARMNAQRALAIDESSAPAMNELALDYLARAGARERGIGTSLAPSRKLQMSLVRLSLTLCEEAAKRYPRFAPTHVTMSLAYAATGDYKTAIVEAARARELDARSFGAHMSFAQASIRVRDFANAEDAYRKALALRPNDYGAHLGLALALRGRISDANLDAQVARVQTELDACRALDPANPDAYYNGALLTQEFKTRASGSKTRSVALLGEARSLYQTFLDRAKGNPDYVDATARARERMRDIDDVLAFLNVH